MAKAVKSTKRGTNTTTKGGTGDDGREEIAKFSLHMDPWQQQTDMFSHLGWTTSIGL